jgi:hypothetical protein
MVQEKIVELNPFDGLLSIKQGFGLNPVLFRITQTLIIIDSQREKTIRNAFFNSINN